jgi:glycosyltransferase involved in cell wall biosynthesis
MDGVSTDSTLEITESLNDNRIKIYSGKDRGIYDAMNKGIDNARGEWLYFLGSDDVLYDDNVLEKIYSIAQTAKGEIIYGNVKIIGDAGWANDGDIYDGEFDLKKILRKNISHQAIFYHNCVYQKLGKYTIDYNRCADWDFNLRCFANYHFMYVTIIVAKFQAGNTSSTGDEKFRKDKWINVLKYFKWKMVRKEFFSYWLTGYTLSH